MRLIFCSLLFLVLGAFLGCAVVSGKPRQATANEFKQELQRINSAYESRMIGVTNDRAYMERTSMVELPSLIGLGQPVVVYWANLSEFTSEEQEALRQGKFLSK